MKISFTAAARNELAETVRWYAEEAGQLRATHFRNAIQRSLSLLIRHPSLGTPSANNTRSLVILRYPYSVIYRADENHLRVLAIASHHRRPGYWAGRR